MNTRRRLAGPEVEEQEAEGCERQADREHQQQPLLVHGQRVDREEGGGDQPECPGEAVHVVEQVERVRHSDQPEQADHRREHVVRDDLHLEAGGERDRRRPELDGELHRRRHRVDVVDEPGGEEQRGAAEDAEQLLVGVHVADADRREDPGGEAEEDADAAERGRRLLAPALAGRVRDESPGDGRVEERPDHERAHGQSDHGCGCAHAGHGNRAVLGRGVEILTG